MPASLGSSDSAASSPVMAPAEPTAAPNGSSSSSSNAPSSPKKRTASMAELPGAAAASAAGGAPPVKITKRRAARACVSCRARKVRCDVVEGAPCGNCRWDNVECVVQESRRRKKNLFAATASAPSAGAAVGHGGMAGAGSSAHGHHHHHVPGVAQAEALAKALGIPTPSAMAQLRQAAAAAAAIQARSGGANGVVVANGAGGAAGGAASGNGAANLNQNGVNVVSAASLKAVDAAATAAAAAAASGALEGHVPHLIYQRSGYRSDSVSSGSGAAAAAAAARLLWSNVPLHQRASLYGDLRTAAYLDSLVEPDAASQLPSFIRPLPAKISDEDVDYLVKKRALSLPGIPLQNALLRAYVEFVHPYMPLLELHDFLASVNSRDGLCGQVSLLLYQAVMFSAVAFVDMQYLKEAGFANRKAARKAFYSRTRLLYDFDYESDRLILVQSLLLMSYWYETPDDQKDTWHWMGVAISLAHTIGLHRDPDHANMSPRKQKLWKRIWWSGFMRDRLIALGMRRPMRVQDDDFDVPMLEESDFEIEVLANDITVIAPECTLIRDTTRQLELAQMCIAKARLCVLVGHMLKAQYSVVMRDKSRPDNTVNSTMMLFPHKRLDNYESVNVCDLKLLAWAESLPAGCQYRSVTAASSSGSGGGDAKEPDAVGLQRTLLHMIFHTTVSALHRPQIQPSPSASAQQPYSQTEELQEMARRRVREAALQITRMAAELHQDRLDRFLPTTGVTVVLPALITHLVDIKNSDPVVRDRAAKGFRMCLKVMERLRDMYSAADYATIFVNEALRKAAGVDLSGIGAGGAGGKVANATSNVQKWGEALHQNQQQSQQQQQQQQHQQRLPASAMSTPPPDNLPYLTAAEASQYQQSRLFMRTQQQQQQQQQLQMQQQQQQAATASPFQSQQQQQRPLAPRPSHSPMALPASLVGTPGAMFGNAAVSTPGNEFVVPPTPMPRHHSVAASMGGGMASAGQAAGVGASPPPTEKDLDSAVGLTPSATGSSDASSGASVAAGATATGLAGGAGHLGLDADGTFSGSLSDYAHVHPHLNMGLDLGVDMLTVDFGAYGSYGAGYTADVATAAAAAAADALLFDWDAAPPTALDFDQWLQFPPTADPTVAAAAAALQQQQQHHQQAADETAVIDDDDDASVELDVDVDAAAAAAVAIGARYRHRHSHHEATEPAATAPTAAISSEEAAASAAAAPKTTPAPVGSEELDEDDVDAEFIRTLLGETGANAANAVADITAGNGIHISSAAAVPAAAKSPAEAMQQHQNQLSAVDASLAAAADSWMAAATGGGEDDMDEEGESDEGSEEDHEMEDAEGEAVADGDHDMPDVKMEPLARGDVALVVVA